MNKRIISGIAALSLVLTSTAVTAFADEAEGEYDTNPGFSVAAEDDDADSFAFVDDNNAAFDDGSVTYEQAPVEETVPQTNFEPAAPATVETNTDTVDDADCYNPFANNGFGYGYGFNNGFNNPYFNNPYFNNNFNKPSNKPAKPDTNTNNGTSDSSGSGSSTTTPANKPANKPVRRNYAPSFWDYGKVNWFYGVNRDDYNNAPKISPYVYGYGTADNYTPIFNWSAFIDSKVEDGKPTQSVVFTKWNPFTGWVKVSAPKKCVAKKAKAKKAKKCKAKKVAKKKVVTKVVYVPVAAPTPAPRQVVFTPVYNFRTYFRNANHYNWNWAKVKFPFKVNYREYKNA
jgi:hypothetical protein